MTDTPKCFISYSHDNEEHKKWVLMLSTRLLANGVDVILDQWNIRLGSDLPSFMEKGLTDVDRIISICSENYVNKANRGQGGVGYEKMILTTNLMRDINSDKIIPLIRNNSSSATTPIFLSTKLYIDFRKDEEFENSYIELIKEVHGEKTKARPALGQNPFIKKDSPIANNISIMKSKYISPFNEGTIEFDYDNNNGVFKIGEGDAIFDISFSSAGNDVIHVLNDPPSIEGIALANGINEIHDIGDASLLDYTSRHRTVRVGEILALVNKNGFFAAIKIEKVKYRSKSSDNSNVCFTYKIKQDLTSTFKNT